MAKAAFLFPGQGAQYTGMGRQLFECSPAAAEVFARADAIRPGTSRQCFEGSLEELTQTKNTQPCMFTAELAAAAALRESGIEPVAAAGFSLGEITALTFAGMVSFEEGFRLVCARGEFMQRASEAVDSSMAAVLKLPDEKVEELASKYEHVYPVNYNCPGQVSCAGLRQELEAFSADVKAAGGRAVPLKVAGAFHSPFMDSAARELEAYLAQLEIKPPRLDIYSDCTGQVYQPDYRELICRQVCSPVRWQRIIENMSRAGVDTFIEVGPGKTLSGLVKKTLTDVRIYGVEDAEGLKKVLSEVQ
ncbi:MAG: ACP S-malonyltransferase [Oscillospiraceae bacterium]|nr:ACP S-malonyltransferase [Oscillospiraceae bacterium]